MHRCPYLVAHTGQDASIPLASDRELLVELLQLLVLIAQLLYLAFVFGDMLVASCFASC